MTTASAFPDFSGIAALRDAVSSRRVSARELATDALRRVHDQAGLNAFLQVDDALTLDQADAVDRQLAAGQSLPLAGVPIAHKDVFVTQGWRTTAAGRMLADYVSPFDGSVVERLRDAGAVSLGKLNCDEFAMGSSGEFSAFGLVRNPWHPEHVAGGSSGGSAVATATGLVMGATGSDTGGSIRQPAALCGISGIKPTYGTVSRYGLIAFASSLDQAGPMARSAEDLLELLDVMAGFDPRDPTSLVRCGDADNAPGRIRSDFHTARAAQDQDGARPLAGLRIGVPAEFFGPELSPDTATAVEAALQQLEALGARRVAVQLPHTELAVPAYYVIGPAEASSNLARFDGVRYGYRTPQYTDLTDMVQRSRSEAFGAEVQRRILIGTYVLSQGSYDAYYRQAQRLRRLIAEDYLRLFRDQCDILAGPVTPSPARRIGEAAGDPTADWAGDTYTIGANLAGLPALSIPCGFSGGERPLPIGLQLIGNHYTEGQLLAVAARFQQATDWHQRKPGHA